MLDLKKPLQTRGGRNVKICHVESGDMAYPIVGIVEGEKCYRIWNWEGYIFSGSPSGVDLVNTRTEQTLYCNMYPDVRIGCTHKSRDEADRNATSGRIACIKITLIEGRFDE